MQGRSADHAACYSQIDSNDAERHVGKMSVDGRTMTYISRNLVLLIQRLISNRGTDMDGRTVLPAERTDSEHEVRKCPFSIQKMNLSPGPGIEGRHDRDLGPDLCQHGG
jgi:hypothetical protein